MVQSHYDLDVSANDALRYKDLTKPIDCVEDKWRMVPVFLQTKGLMKQQIASYNHLVDHGLNEIVAANKRIESDVDPLFYLE